MRWRDNVYPMTLPTTELIVKTNSAKEASAVSHCCTQYLLLHLSGELFYPYRDLLVTLKWMTGYQILYTTYPMT